MAEKDKGKTRTHTPLFLLLLLLLQLLQVLLGDLQDLRGLLLGGAVGGGEVPRRPVEGGARGGPGQVPPQTLTHRFTLQQLRPAGQLQRRKRSQIRGLTNQRKRKHY